jgi:hypothetical protein
MALHYFREMPGQRNANAFGNNPRYLLGEVFSAENILLAFYEETHARISHGATKMWHLAPELGRRQKGIPIRGLWE